MMPHLKRKHMRPIRFLQVLWEDGVREHIFEIIGVVVGLISLVVLVPTKDTQQTGWVFPVTACLFVSVTIGLITTGASVLVHFVFSSSYQAICNAWDKSKPDTKE